MTVDLDRIERDIADPQLPEAVAKFTPAKYRLDNDEAFQAEERKILQQLIDHNRRREEFHAKRRQDFEEKLRSLG